jgi:hypothetical protein
MQRYSAALPALSSRPRRREKNKQPGLTLSAAALHRQFYFMS